MNIEEKYDKGGEGLITNGYWRKEKIKEEKDLSQMDMEEKYDKRGETLLKNKYWRKL